MVSVIYVECHLCCVSFMLSVIYAECRYAECRYAECRYAECRYAECRYAECHGVIKSFHDTLYNQRH
jgi:hypothetical protein